MLTLYFALGASSFAVHIALHEIDSLYARMMTRPAVQRTIAVESAIGYELPA